MYKTIQAAFGESPLVVKPSSYVAVLSFVAGPDLSSARQKLGGVPTATEWAPKAPSANIELVRDDWPYLYYNPETIPYVYLGSLLLVMVFG